MKVLFLHGLGSDPDGVRPAFLKAGGHEVIHPALDDDDFEASARIADEAFHRGEPDVVVGSSRGGAVAMSIDTGDVPLVLIAPACKHWAPSARLRKNVRLLHSEHDDVVPIEDRRKLLRQSGLPPTRLMIAGAGHKMTDPEALDALLGALDDIDPP